MNFEPFGRGLVALAPNELEHLLTIIHLPTSKHLQWPPFTWVDQLVSPAIFRIKHTTVLVTNSLMTSSAHSSCFALLCFLKSTRKMCVKFCFWEKYQVLMTLDRVANASTVCRLSRLLQKGVRPLFEK